MNKLTKILIYSCSLLVAAGCDTVEDSFVVGSIPKETEFLRVDHSQVSFVPDGGSYEIQINSIATWEISIANNNEGQFSVSPSSGKGNATVTVTCKPNSTQTSFSAEMVITPKNFEMEPVKVALSQANATFSIERTPSSEPIPEEGGSVTMTAYSSLNWELVVVAHDADGNVGDLEWLSVTPGLSGESNDGNTPIEYRFTWTPNYTDRERTIRLQLKPSTNMTLSGLPLPFTLSQQPGTLPQGVRCVVDRLELVDADISFEYSSRSPVKDCGLRVYEVGTSGESLMTTVSPERNGGEYAANGSYKLMLKDLPEHSKFRVEPFVENQVGAVSGDSREMTTGTKPENMVYQGVSIVNADNGGVTVTAGLNYATVSCMVVSDVEPLDPDRMASAIINIGGKQVNGTPEKIVAGTWNYVFNVTGLEANHEYDYSIEVKGKDLPREQGTVVSNTATYSGKLKTLGMTPDGNDNNKPNVGI